MFNLLYRLLNPKHDRIKYYLKDASVILEIGSHVGTDTIHLRKNFPNAKIFCFEPDPRTAEIFRIYRKDLNAELITKAISNKNGNSKFYQAFYKHLEEFTINKYSWIDKELIKKNKLSKAGASSLKTGHETTSTAEIINVETIRLDDWAKQNSIENVDLIWIDAQGAEKDIFEGGANILKKTRYIWTEFGATDYEGGMSWKETKNELKDNFNLINYESYFRTCADMFFKNKFMD